MNTTELQRLARLIEIELKKDNPGIEPGFCLFVFPLNEEFNRVHYVSNTSDRQVMGRAIKKMINRWEKEAPSTRTRQ